MENNRSMLKVILIGDSAVGKSSLVRQLIDHTFDDSNEATIGAAYVSKTFQTRNGDLELHVWDTAGQERFRSIIPLYSRGCSGALVVFSVDSKESYSHVPGWVQVLKDSGDKNCKIYIVANKIDLGHSPLIVDAKHYAEENGFQFFETTAKEYSSVERIFQCIADDLSEYDIIEPSSLPSNILGQDDAPSKQKSGCC